MKLIVTIETASNQTIRFDYTEPDDANGFDDRIYSNGRLVHPGTDLERATAELQRITHAVAAMGSTTVKVDPTTVTIDPKSIETAVRTAINGFRNELTARAQAGKMAAAAKREGKR